MYNLAIAALLLLCLVLIYAALFIIRFVKFMRIMRSLVFNTEVFEQRVNCPRKRVLICGDSYQAGVGVEDPTESLAGMLGNKYPDCEITNISYPGDELKDAVQKVRLINSKFDLIVIQLGTNDIFNHRPLEHSRRNLIKLLDMCQKLSGKILYIHTGVFTYTSLIPWWLEIFYDSKSVRFIKMCESILSERNIRSINFFKTEPSKIFKSNTSYYYAADRYHLNKNANRVWFPLIENEVSTLLA